MTNTGITRKIDELGRIVLPVELRKQLGWEVKDFLDICHDSDKVILSKPNPSCIFCGGNDEEGLSKFKGKSVCAGCQSESWNES